MNGFLEKLLAIDSPSGYTFNATSFIKKSFQDLGYDVFENKKGNLHVFVNNDSDVTVGLSAHCDTLGFVVRSINSNGTLLISPVGGPIMSTVNGEYCKIYTRDDNVYTGTILNKSSAIHVHKDASEKVVSDNLIVRIDEPVFSKDDVAKLGINNGDFVCYDPKVQFVSGFVKSRFLDDKAGVAVLYYILKELKNTKVSCNVQLIVSTYEEVGHGGSNIPNVDELIAIDMGCVGNELDGNEFKVSICAKDSSGPYDYKMTSKLIDIAKEHNIDYAIDVYPMYGSDASAALRAGNDIRAALIGPGVDSSHGMERTSLSAIKNTATICLEYLKTNAN